MKVLIKVVLCSTLFAASPFAQQPPSYLTILNTHKNDSIKMCQIYFVPTNHHVQVNNSDPDYGRGI